jgi:hypothetical protein
MPLRENQAARKPRVFRRSEVEDKSGFRRIPKLGSSVPNGWKPADRRELEQFWPKGVYEAGLFVDSSGFGRPGEPALTIDQFQRGVLAAMDAGKRYGYGISSVGRFQIHIQVFVQFMQTETDNRSQR